jgi:hypothetical protein
MKASLFQKCGLALALALTPFFGGCDAGQSASAAPVDQSAAEVSNAQTSPDPAAADADAEAQDTNSISAADVSAGTNADAALENANGKLISSPDTAGTNVSNNPQLTDFVKLVQAGVGESVLLAYVTNSATAFSVSSDDILYLNDLGTPETVVAAMLAKDQQINGTAATAPTITVPDATAPTAPPMNPNMYAGAGNGAPPSTDDLNAAGPVQTPPMIPSDAVEQEVQQSPNASYTYFYDSLAPYGYWVNLDGYGPCWQPTVVVANSGWTPYGDRGHWAYTDCGWCWVSDYSWGWAPFHYGRWFHNTHYGWCWAPDTVWGPAWVSWRYSDAYCGWAPLPPSACYRPGFGFSYYGRSVGFSFGFGLRVNSFTFVGMNHFHDRNPARYRVEHREVTRIYKTTVINNTIIRGNNNTLINRGVPVTRVAAATHQDIRPIRIQAEANSPRAPQLGRDGRSLAVYRPNLPTPRPGQAPRLVGEGVKPAPDFNLHNRVEQNQARAVAPRRPTGPYAPAVTPEHRPIIGNQNVNRPENAVRDNQNDRFNQPNNEKPGSLIMRGPNNQSDRQIPIREQNPAPNQPDRGNNPRVATPPLTPGGQPFRNQSDVRQNPARELNQPSVTRPDLEQSQRQQRQSLQQQQQSLPQQQRDFQQQQQQQQRDFQSQQRQIQQQQQQQQREFQQQQRQQFQQQPAPRQEAPSRSIDVPRAQQPSYQPPVRSEGTPRMNDARPAPEMRSAPQYSAPARSEGGGGGGGNRGGGGNGNGNNNNGGGRGR